MSRREEAKEERRRRIITAARDLIRETGDAGLSMRAIASRAQVSLSTPSNLFGSKRAILIAVLEDIGTPEAVAVLKSLAAGAEPARLTQEARRSQERANGANVTWPGTSYLRRAGNDELLAFSQ